MFRRRRVNVIGRVFRGLQLPAGDSATRAGGPQSRGETLADAGIHLRKPATISRRRFRESFCRGRRSLPRFAGEETDLAFAARADEAGQGDRLVKAGARRSASH